MRPAPRSPRLRRVDCSAPGLKRVRRGRGFSFVGSDGEPVDEAGVLERVRALGIPPAWEDVWICSDPRGHLQATGVDAAGRKQYLYHPVWRELRDRQKFAVMEDFARALPRLRRAVAEDLDSPVAGAGAGALSRGRVLACAARLLDVGLFRVGGEEYAKEEGGVGLATLLRSHVTVKGNEVAFDFPAKSGVRRRWETSDPDVLAVVGALRRGRRAPASAELLAYRDGRRWVDVSSDDINAYVKDVMGEQFSAKDFRTWNATVLAAVFLARRVHADSARAASKTSRKRAMSAVAREVSEQLGNTPAVARRSYIDPRVYDRYLSGMTIVERLAGIESVDEPSERRRRRIELAVLELLADNSDSPVLDVDEELAAAD